MSQDPEKKRRAKELHRKMKHNPIDLSHIQHKETIDCACVIHGNLYEWGYVERLYRMVSQNLSYPIRFHVFTESSRSVPNHMIKHCLTDWHGVEGRKRAWWYKMQMFDPKHVAGQLLYLDLDVVVTGNLDWITGLDRQFFWSIKDFRYLWRPSWQGINSSMMYWDTTKFQDIWDNFRSRDLASVMRQYAGDQDFLSDLIDQKTRRFMDPDLVRSWRWQVKDGGMDMRTRSYNRPGAGAVITPQCSVIVFHGNPKPHEVPDHAIQQRWNA